MPPTLRSSNSNNNSPISLSNGSSLGTGSVTPRKAPQCSKCKRPRAGHPRSGCPYMDSPTKEKGKRQNTLEGHLSIALESMIIATPDRVERDEETKAFIRNRRRLSAQPLAPSESLLSLSTNSSEIVARLLQPGIFDDTDDEGASDGTPASRIVRWQETVAATPALNRALKSKTPARSPMPGTLIPPTPESSFASSHNSTAKVEVISAHLTEAVAGNASMTSDATQRAQPLMRSMSAAERDIFVSKLTDEASATIYIIPKVDVEEVVAKANSLKFYTHISMSNNVDDSHALLILGRDEAAVDALLRKIENENKKAHLVKLNSGRGGSSTLKTAAGAAVVGAVGAWAGLAFS